MMSARIPIAGPWITDKEIQYVREAVTNGWYANSGKYQGEFEQAASALYHPNPVAKSYCGIEPT